MTLGPRRVCVKLFASEPAAPDSVFVTIFHEWIRRRALPFVLLDVADYAHVPDSPGVVLVAHEATFALDRSDGRFGLLAQQRRPTEGGAADAITTTLRQALSVAERLEADARLSGLRFDRHIIRIEANDRLRAPNTDAGFHDLVPAVQRAVGAVHPASSIRVARIDSAKRERLAVDVQVSGHDGVAAR